LRAQKRNINTAEEKAERERRIFSEFARMRGLPTGPDSAQSAEPPAPDILYRGLAGTTAAFELVELCNAPLAAEISRLTKDATAKPAFLWVEDPTEQAYFAKLKKTYESDVLIELICYTDGRLVTPDDGIEMKLRDLVRMQGTGPFSRIWLFGENVCSEIVA
jgi:hypothetical protein